MDRVGDLHVAHVRRLRGLDPAIRLPEIDLSADPEVLLADDGEAVALVEAQHTDPRSPPGLWVEEHVVRVQVRCSEAASPEALRDLLVRAHEAVPDAGPAHLTIAARDLMLLRPLLRAGFAPGSVVAHSVLSASARAESTQGEHGLVVRPATPQDVESVVAAGVAVHAFDGRAGVLPDRPDAATVLREGAAESLAEHEGWCWVAEQDGEVAGVCEVKPPGAALWATNWVAHDGPVAYLALLHVNASSRGRGIGRALVAAAHRRVSASGATRVILHYGGTNPLSVPFWGRAGYRPLVGGWLRQVR